MTSSDLLQQLYNLDKSSSEFHDQLSSILYGQEYQEHVPNLQGDRLAWLVDYLDKVRLPVSPLRLSLKLLSLGS